MVDDKLSPDLRRPIVPLDIEGMTLSNPVTLPPTLEWIDPTKLLVDDTYQRSISVKGQKLIRKILADFDWRKFKPPTIVQTEDGYEVLDGQHSAIAAASHPAIDKIPVLIVDAAARPDRASTFIGINRDRLAVNPMQLHSASVVSGHPIAMEIEAICREANINILRSARQPKDYKPGDTIAVRAIEALIKRQGRENAASLLGTLSAAGLAPISAAAIKASEFLIFGLDEGERIEAADLTPAIQLVGDQADREASLYAAEHDVAQWRGLASVWLRKTRRRKPKSDSHNTRKEARTQASEIEAKTEAEAD